MAEFILKIYKFLKPKKIKDLEIITQDELNKFVDDVLSGDKERLAKAQNVIYLGNLNKELANALGIDKIQVYMRKNELHHIIDTRKGDYNQDVPKENFKNLQKLITNASEAYIDITTKHRNFFLMESLDDDNIATYHFNRDWLGNYFLTARRIEKTTLNQKSYKKLVARGIEPTHTESCDSTLPSQSSTTNSRTNPTTKKQMSQEEYEKFIKERKERATEWKNLQDEFRNSVGKKLSEMNKNSSETKANITQTTQQPSVDGDIDTNTSPRGPRL